MTVVNLKDIYVSYGGAPLLDELNLEIQDNERVCLLGRNGAGKSTLMKLISGNLEPDRGDIEKRRGVVISSLPQEVPLDLAGRVFSIVAEALGDLGKDLIRYHDLTERLAIEDSASLQDEMQKLQDDLDDKDAWALQKKVESILMNLKLDGDVDFDTLSGGLKRRVLLAKALLQEPDLLLLDEPTNHLDVDSITWLETFLQGFKKSILFITHDRAFLKKIATRIIDLDRGRVSSWDCGYEKFLERRQVQLEAEEKENAIFDKKLAQEEAWIRQGIKARRTRNEGRVRRLKELRNVRKERREQMGSAKLSVQQSDKSGVKVVEVEGVSYAYDGSNLIDNFSTVISRGDKIGLIGPNGVGKTTLIQLLLGQLQPNTGAVKHGTNLDIVYFDQYREQLNENQSVADNVSGGNDKVFFNGQSKHVITYLQDFLFGPDRARGPVNALSGGEKNRLLLARLFLKPCNVLVLDEPTNDLDIETLDLLESLLVDFQGTLLLVSHDREFLDNVVTSSFVFEGNGRIRENVGGYSDWIDYQNRTQVVTKATTSKQKKGYKPKTESGPKLTYKEQKELESLPQKIEELEAKQAELHELLGDPDIYQNEPDRVGEIQAEVAELEEALMTCYERWESLEAIRELAEVK